MFSKEWINRYFDLAEQISLWSKDPSSKIGAIIIADHGQIISQGYNGFPRKIHDLEKRLEHRETKYKYIVHGEMNCIYNACLTGQKLNNTKLFVYGLPICSECAKGVIQSGISHTFMKFPTIKNLNWLESFSFTKEMFNEANVYYEVYNEYNELVEKNESTR